MIKSLIFSSYGNETDTFAIVKSVITFSVFGILYHAQHIKQMAGEALLYQYLTLVTISFTIKK